MLERGPNVSGLLEPDWVECRPIGASGLMTPWWLPQPGGGTPGPGVVICLDLLTSVLMKKFGGGRALACFGLEAAGVWLEARGVRAALSSAAIHVWACLRVHGLLAIWSANRMR